ncbi:CdaR family transcriptional regulator [Aquibacillus sediminis]|uniref:CdaR family transcriptional regulator n=1 Tax=Aquibacillus sediminis TaxID=2574734 RepID=UPI001107DAB9|nr:sugar diacid recognition domain-containing protein [Aquibacillus sediminis]
MEVSSRLATNIVDRMKDIINKDINYIDRNCIIIASTDKERIGNFHEGAKRVLDSNEKIIITDANQYEGTRKGINVPVYHENEIIGVIGITGREKEVSKFGEIIKSMTEILIKEAFIQEQLKFESDRKKQFVEDLLFRISDEDEESIKMRADLLDIEINVPRIVVIARLNALCGESPLLSSVYQGKIHNTIKRHINFDSQNIIIQSGINIIFFLKSESLNDVKKLLDIIMKKLQGKYEVSSYFGIGSEGTNKYELRESYEKARKALNVALITRGQNIIFYNELDIELIIEDLSESVKEKYIYKVLGNLEEKLIDTYIDILSKYIKNNGSINKTADELFLHKNTLQYKLKKLKKETGYDPRLTHDLVVLYLAIITYTNIKNS